MMSGVSFLPKTEHVYRQPPYEAVTEEDYKNLLSEMPKDIDWSTFQEEIDNTTASKELACTGNNCEIT